MSDEFIRYDITGVLYRSNKRFRSTYTNYFYAMSINLWHGSVWGVMSNGKRRLLKRVVN